MKSIFFMAFVCLTACGKIPAFHSEQDGTAIESTSVSTIVQDVASEFDRRYVSPEKGAKVANNLRKSLQTGRYDNIKYSEELANLLTDDIRGITKDIHAFVRYSSNRVANPAYTSAAFERVERLQGNIGYIKLAIFSVPDKFRPSANAAMGLLADTDALIIDLRTTPGGHAGSVDYLCSFFFDPSVRTLLNTHSFRNRQPFESWTVRTPSSYLYKPVYVLISQRTASGAEAFAYTMGSFGLATLVGEITAGGAHSSEIISIGHNFSVTVPTGQTRNSQTGANWEQTGVVPDLPATAESALELALHALHERGTTKSE